MEITGEFFPAPSEDHILAVREIIRLGGRISPGKAAQNAPKPGELETRVTLGDSWSGERKNLQLLAKLDRIDRLDIRTTLPDGAPEELQNAVQTRSISLTETGLTDGGLQFLKHWPHLKTISLYGPFTDAAVVANRALRWLHVKELTAIDPEDR